MLNQKFRPRLMGDARVRAQSRKGLGAAIRQRWTTECPQRATQTRKGASRGGINFTYPRLFLRGQRYCSRRFGVSPGTVV